MQRPVIEDCGRPFADQMNRIFKEFAARQMRLEPEFEAVIFDNLEELYESDGEAKNND